ncbi:MAG: extracellular solute-binding protein [Elusimicrobiota bacterium]
MRDLQLWVLPNNAYETLPTLREHLAPFRREHPGIRVSVTVRTAASLWTHLFRLLKGPRPEPRPDVVQIPAHWTSTLANLGMLMDLGELDPGIDLGRWPAALRDQCRLAGTPQVYSLPWWMEIRLLYYRKDVFRRAGLDPAKVLAGWEGLREACRALARQKRSASAPLQRHPIANPNPRESVSMTDLAPCVWSRGGEFFSPDGSRCLFSRERACRGIGDYFELLSAGWMPLKGPSGLVPRDLFDGHCALQFSDRLPRAVSNGKVRGRAPQKLLDEVGAVPLPGDPGTTLLAAQHLAVLRDTESPREAYALLRELVDGRAAAAYARAIGALPAKEGADAKVLEEFPEFKEAFALSFQRARMLPNLGVMGTLEKVFDRSMEQLVRDVVRKTFSPQALRQELIHAAAEMDFIMSLRDQ